MNINSIPIDLKNIIDPEQPDFIVRTKRNYPRKKGMSMLFFSLFWNAFISIFVIAFIVPLVSGQEVHFKTNDVPTSGSLENYWSFCRCGHWYVHLGNGHAVSKRCIFCWYRNQAYKIQERKIDGKGLGAVFREYRSEAKKSLWRPGNGNANGQNEKSK